MNSEEVDQAKRIDVDALPPAAQRWLARALPDGRVIPARYQIEQEGSMDVRGRWTAFSATGIYDANPLFFEWKARLRMLPGVWIEAEDGHRQGSGWGGARLWGLISMGRKSDPEVLKAQVVRNLAELAWLPALAVAETALVWVDAGENAFEIRSDAGGQEAIVRFEIDAQADIVRAYSPARPYDVPDGFAEAPWTYEFSDHTDFGGQRIPAATVATFEKPDGPWQYLRIKIVSISRDT